MGLTKTDFSPRKLRLPRDGLTPPPRSIKGARAGLPYRVRAHRGGQAKVHFCTQTAMRTGPGDCHGGSLFQTKREATGALPPLVLSRGLHSRGKGLSDRFRGKTQLHPQTGGVDGAERWAPSRQRLLSLRGQATPNFAWQQQCRKGEGGRGPLGVEG